MQVTEVMHVLQYFLPSIVFISVLSELLLTFCSVLRGGGGGGGEGGSKTTKKKVWSIGVYPNLLSAPTDWQSLW